MPVKKARAYKKRPYRKIRKSKTLMAIKKNGIAKLSVSTPSTFTDFRNYVDIGAALPRKIKGSLTSSDFVTHTLSTTVNVMNYILLNSLHDPFSTSGSRQAFAFDKLSPLYRAYYVYGCTVTIKLRTISDSSPIQFSYGITGQDYYTSTQDLQGVPMGDSGLITKESGYSCRFYVDLFKAGGLKRNNDDQNNPFASVVNGDPPNKIWLCLSQENCISSTQTTVMNIVLEQHYVMFDPKDSTMVD